MVFVIDNGTTNTKVFLFDRDGEIAARASAPTPTACPGPGLVEQEAGAWWAATVRASGQIEGAAKSRLEALSSSAQGGTFAVLSKTLEPLGPGVTWLDARASGEAGRLERRFGREFFYRRTGHFLGGWSPPAVLRWLKKNDPDRLRAAARISFVSDFLNHRLTGRFFLDHTAAGMTMLYDPVAGDWDGEILEIAGIGPGQLPEIVPAGEEGGRLTGEAARRLGLPRGTPVISGGHDQYCASLGSGAARPGDCLVSCGTAWVLLVCLSKPLFRPGTAWSPGRHLEPGAWGLMAAISEGGILLDWVRKNFRLGEKRREQPAGTGKVLFRPGFGRGRGAIANLDFSSDGDTVYQAALQALAGEVRDRLQQLKGRAPVDKLFLVGGGRREPLLAPLLRETTGRTVFTPAVGEAAARGAALLALGKMEINGGRKE